ncbi:MAG: glycosyltransferase family 4 protein [Verrucomicrobiota bacterium]
MKILFLDKVLNKRVKDDRLRGVEVFNVCFLRDLVSLGHEVTLVIHPDWRPIIEREIPRSDRLVILESSKRAGKNLGCLVPFWRERKAKFDVLFLANVGNGLLIPYRFIQRFKMVDRTVLLAHKVPGERFLKSIDRKTVVVSVNHTISRPFEEAGFEVAEVYYGILDAKLFYPSPKSRSPEPLKFGMLGDLDSEWKGSDLAIKAFTKLPEEVADRCELHLAAFTHDMPNVDDPRIVTYHWIEREKVGDFLRSLDVMLCLSRDLGEMMETFCQTMVQGMLCQLPQIVTPLEVFEEKLDEGGGMIVEDVESLVAAMTELASDQSTREALGLAAEKIARDRYVWDSEYFVSRFFRELKQ